ncbi:MAG: hypothetical protein EAZ08_09565 [Cytophagales bacterium]|nr:MAG: hypothetical protein EAZ08_09565 [Cytophagales bacterium]
MNKDNYKIYVIDEDRELNLFKKAIIVFDTSALLDFYYYSESTRKEIFEKLFTKLKGRLWITSQTEFEFLKNREIVFKKPIDTYENLNRKTNKAAEGGHIDEIKRKIDELSAIIKKDMQGQLKTLIEKTSKNDRHPYLDKDIFSDFEDNTKLLEQQVSKFTDFFDSFKASFEKEVNQKKTQLEKSLLNDEVLQQFECFFKTTKPFTFSEILQIIEEGEIRYRNRIPPGYMDDDEKVGFQKYGDLIVWKEIIRNITFENQDIVLVTNDMKEDWWQLSDKSRSNSPRYELIKEIFDMTGRSFWMYDMKQFLFKSKKYLQTEIEKETIDDVTQTINEEQKQQKEIFGEFIWLWREIEKHLRNLTIHYATIDINNKQYNRMLMPREMVSFLININIVLPNIGSDIMILSDVRNKLVHGVILNIDNSMINLAENILEYLSKIHIEDTNFL